MWHPWDEPISITHWNNVAEIDKEGIRDKVPPEDEKLLHIHMTRHGPRTFPRDALLSLCWVRCPMELVLSANSSSCAKINSKFLLLESTAKYQNCSGLAFLVTVEERGKTDPCIYQLNVKMLEAIQKERSKQLPFNKPAHHLPGSVPDILYTLLQIQTVVVRGSRWGHWNSRKLWGGGSIFFPKTHN